MREFYILKDKKPVLVDEETWKKVYYNTDRHIDFDEIGKVQVTTIFLGTNYNHSGAGPPILFETMVFRGPHHGYMKRSSTWDEAKAQHRVALQIVKGS